MLDCGRHGLAARGIVHASSLLQHDSVSGFLCSFVVIMSLCRNSRTCVPQAAERRHRVRLGDPGLGAGKVLVYILGERGIGAACGLGDNVAPAGAIPIPISVSISVPTQASSSMHVIQAMRVR